ncbi:LytTR family DNA-binding domain-containing protein [Clostridium sp. AM58-1XD]|uniref:LytR/AlgR family response regulator transcription factor n=1 Tax=Clostridium sp. AM58-1XD TaxID=2292307 RepID=UPI000E4CB390|nr:LytTR family DNA-binding domain-containing protein [Clostridium sp. AM58-1XD]RGY96001.1 DNA-binding response regulator [Clostridium sp. AM58-1XD]
MIKIAICDDESGELRQLETLIKAYDKEHPELDISFKSYSSSAELLFDIEENAYHIYLLDIIMDGKDGIEIGKAIRDVDKKAAIIYATISPDYAVQSYTVEALYYLVKPFNEDKLFPVLDRAAKKLIKGENGCFSVRTRKGLRSLRNSAVIYIEYHSHRLSYHLAGGEVVESLTFRESFDQVSGAILKDEMFVKISKSYIVNFRQIESITKKGFIMKDGTEIAVSRLYANIKKDYMDYVLRGGDCCDL